MYFGARYYDPDTGRFINQDEYLGEQEVPPSLHRYLYAYSNPTVYVDEDGNLAETAWDVANIGMGVHSFVGNIKEKKYGAALLDAVGVVADTAAAALPFVPGGVGATIKSVRTADKINDARRAVDKAADTGRAIDKISDAEKQRMRAKPI